MTVKTKRVSKPLFIIKNNNNNINNNNNNYIIDKE
jgi:hypothetical protein